MSEEATTPDLVELVRRYVEAASRRDFDAIQAFYAADVVLLGAQIGTFEGRAAARGVLEDVCAPYEEFLRRNRGGPRSRLRGDLRRDRRKRPCWGRQRRGPIPFASMAIWREGLVKRQTNYTDIDEVGAAAERLAKERG